MHGSERFVQQGNMAADPCQWSSTNGQNPPKIQNPPLSYLNFQPKMYLEIYNKIITDEAAR